MKLNIAYIILLSLQVPFNIAYLKMLIANVEGDGAKILGIGYLIIVFLYFIALGVLGIKSIYNSFKAYKEQDFEYCIKGLMVLKYGMIPFFIVNFLSIAIMTIILLGASRGALLFVAPIYLTVVGGGTWIAMLPSSFYGVQVVRFGAKEEKIGKSKIWHILFQFCFLADVLDAIYLTTFKYKRGKIPAIIVVVIYIVCIIMACAFLRTYLVAMYG